MFSLTFSINRGELASGSGGTAIWIMPVDTSACTLLPSAEPAETWANFDTTFLNHHDDDDHRSFFFFFLKVPTMTCFFPLKWHCSVAWRQQLAVSNDIHNTYTLWHILRKLRFKANVDDSKKFKKTNSIILPWNFHSQLDFWLVPVRIDEHCL